jgi:hypothetical protein
MPARSPYDRARMTVLTTTKTWHRPIPVRPDVAPDLTDAERANVKKAVRFLATRHGGALKLAKVLRISPSVVRRALTSRGRPGAALAIRVARAAGSTAENVLEGLWPPAGACPHCWRAPQ